ncbi:hypothetical protein GCM10023186_05170 [Hymenobacter koreensis]|uniref:Uncharacterized protein n=2 Tax=Hymenobacter koreensis TaxID=1084523 RepID=A0ABP8IV23_9BACT
MFQPSSVALSSRLPSLEVSVDNGPLNNSDGAWPDDAQTLFEREVRMNLAEPEDTIRFGYARLQITEVANNRAGKALQAFQLMTLMTPALLGVPLEWYRTAVKAEVQIVNSRGKVLGTYAETGESSIRVAMYHGYSQTQAPRLADMEALRQAIAKIKLKVEVDAVRLGSELLTAGPLEAGKPDVEAAAEASLEE